MGLRKIERDIVAAVIESSDEYLLFGKQNKGGVYEGCWLLIGGGVHEDESHDEALKREILEETGIDITLAQTTLLFDWRKGESEKTLRDTGERVHVLMNFFDYHTRLLEKKEAVSAYPGDDIAELGWFKKEELAHINLSSPARNLLEEMKYL